MFYFYFYHPHPQLCGNFVNQQIWESSEQNEIRTLSKSYLENILSLFDLFGPLENPTQNTVFI